MQEYIGAILELANDSLKITYWYPRNAKIMADTMDRYNDANYIGQTGNAFEVLLML